jgi:hypothetical protein
LAAVPALCHLQNRAVGGRRGAGLHRVAAEVAGAAGERPVHQARVRAADHSRRHDWRLYIGRTELQEGLCNLFGQAIDAQSPDLGGKVCSPCRTSVPRLDPSLLAVESRATTFLYALPRSHRECHKNLCRSEAPQIWRARFTRPEGISRRSMQDVALVQRACEHCRRPIPSRARWGTSSLLTHLHDDPVGVRHKKMKLGCQVASLACGIFMVSPSSMYMTCFQETPRAGLQMQG